MRELAIAVDRGRPIIPLRIENVSPTGALEYFLSVIQWIDAAQSPLEKHLVDLHNEVLAILETGKQMGSSLGCDIITFVRGESFGRVGTDLGKSRVG